MTSEADTIGGLLRHFAEHLPDAPAILTPGREPLSFRELGRQADYVEETLNGWGIGRGDRVAIVVPERPETAVTQRLVRIPASAITWRMASSSASGDSIRALPKPVSTRVSPERTSSAARTP